MASASRALWKGAISFGLVHIPVSLHAATTESGIDFDWLDKRTMDPVGYLRINKKTGKQIEKANIVKGVAYEAGKYVVLSDEEIAEAFPRSTQSIDIDGFVGIDEIPFVFLDRPYYLAPVGKGAKVYALLRETLLKTRRIGLARVVIHTRQHLAALVPSGPALVLNLLRWGSDIRTWDDLDLPPEGDKAAGLTERELAMARQLVEDMNTKWDADAYRDSFKDAVMALVHKKVEAGESRAAVEPEEQAPSSKSADIYDLTELLQRSLGKGKGKGKASPEAQGAAKTPPLEANPAAKRARPSAKRPPPAANVKSAT